jgi:Domain of unknown function (DUF4260)
MTMDAVGFSSTATLAVDAEAILMAYSQHFVGPAVGREARAGSPAAVGGVRAILRFEGLAVFAAALALYAHLGASWLLFAALFLAPDLTMAAYLLGPRLGAAGYNLVHTYVAPLALGGVGAMLAAPEIVALAAIWAAHIGIDRALGYGLKYATGFGDTHLGRIGRAV